MVDMVHMLQLRLAMLDIQGVYHHAGGLNQLTVQPMLEAMMQPSRTRGCKCSGKASLGGGACGLLHFY